MVESTKVYAGGQTVIPVSIRKELNIDKDDQLNWTIEDGKMVVEVMKQKNLDDIVGIIDLSNQYTLGMNILLAVFGFVLVGSFLILFSCFSQNIITILVILLHILYLNRCSLPQITVASLISKHGHHANKNISNFVPIFSSLSTVICAP